MHIDAIIGNPRRDDGPPRTPSVDLIEHYLGPGRSLPGERVWRVDRFGRLSMVHLYSWADGSQSVKTIDMARPSRRVELELDLGHRSTPRLGPLDEELRALTREPDPD